jgi:hypothetical protein
MPALITPPRPQPLTVTDPISGRVWQIPRTPTTRLHADVRERWFLNVAVPQHLFRAVVPAPFLAPNLRQGAVVLSLCRIAMRHGAPTWAPVNYGPACDNVALRVGCVDIRDGSPAVWVDHRYTDHVLGHVLPLLGFPAVQPLLETTQTDTLFTATTLDGAIDAHAEDYGACQVQPRLFTDGDDLTEWVTAGVRSYGPTDDPERYVCVDLEKCGHNRFVHLPTWRATLATPWGRWIADGVYATRDGFYEWRYLGDVDRAGNPLR